MLDYHEKGISAETAFWLFAILHHKSTSLAGSNKLHYKHACALASAGVVEKAYRNEQAPMCRLDAVISEFKIDYIDLLKIDVEGFEANVLRGCGESLKPERIRYIYFEFHRINKLAENASLMVNWPFTIGRA